MGVCHALTPGGFTGTDSIFNSPFFTALIISLSNGSRLFNSLKQFFFSLFIKVLHFHKIITFITDINIRPNIMGKRT
jgi:hypothetical protein